jgi:hypothetical protein
MKFRGWLVWAALALAACVPAKLPPGLGATPGAAVVVSGERVENAAFSAAYPAGWRVITSPAGEAPFVILAAPDPCVVIQLSLDARDIPEPAGCEASDLRTATETTATTPPVYVGLRAAADGWDAARAAFADVVASVRTAESDAS